MVKLEVLNPVAKLSTQEVTLAARLGDLSGKTIGLWWNNKASGNTVNQFTAEFLAEKFKGIHFKEYFGTIGMEDRHASDEQLETIPKECDAVIGALAN